MTRPDSDRWNQRFAEEGHLFGEAPHRFQTTHAAALPPGRALCVADGKRRNGIWLAEQGWEVVSPHFLEAARRPA